MQQESWTVIPSLKTSEFVEKKHPIPSLKLTFIALKMLVSKLLSETLFAGAMLVSGRASRCSPSLGTTIMVTKSNYLIFRCNVSFREGIQMFTKPWYYHHGSQVISRCFTNIQMFTLRSSYHHITLANLIEFPSFHLWLGHTRWSSFLRKDLEAFLGFQDLPGPGWLRLEVSDTLRYCG